MPELPLDDVERHALTREFERMRVAQPMRREPAPDVRGGREAPELAANGERLPVFGARWYSGVSSDATSAGLQGFGSVRGSPKCRNTPVSLNQVIAAIALPSSVTTMSP